MVLSTTVRVIFLAVASPYIEGSASAKTIVHFDLKATLKNPG